MFQLAIPSGYNCEAESEQWFGEWSIEKAAWCCKHSGIGCPSTTAPPTTSTRPLPTTTTDSWFDCRAEKADFLRSSSGECLGYDFGEGVRVAACTDGDVDRWAADGGALRLLYDFRCLEYNSLSGGLRLQHCTGGANQTWSIDGGTVRSATDGKCLDYAGRQSVVHMNACQGAIDQLWRFDAEALAWSLGEQPWCCRHRGVGCAASTTTQAAKPPSTSQEPEVTKTAPATAPETDHDCGEGFSDWRTTWAPSKKTWCCLREDRGCDLAALGPPPPGGVLGTAEAAPTKELGSVVASPLDCEASPSDPEADWSASKRLYCCLNKGGSGCMVAASTFDCEEAFATWQTSWTRERKTWCCLHHGRGCDLASLLPRRPESASASAAAVLADLGAGRAPPPLPEVYSCEGGPLDAWTAARQLHCCLHEGIGCPNGPPVTDAALYDCKVGQSKSMLEWSSVKLSWCCEHKGFGCTTQTAFDCGAPGATWPEAQRHWCCSQRGLGCGLSTTTPVPYECDLGSLWTWSYGKTQWCCELDGVGCTTTTSSPPALRYDCDAEYADFERAWSNKKMAWCCFRRGRGCGGVAAQRLPSSAQLSFECSAASPNWQDEWSDAKKLWCCLHAGLGCTLGGGNNQDYYAKFAQPRRQGLGPLLDRRAVLACLALGAGLASVAGLVVAGRAAAVSRGCSRRSALAVVGAACAGHEVSVREFQHRMAFHELPQSLPDRYPGVWEETICRDQSGAVAFD